MSPHPSQCLRILSFIVFIRSLRTHASPGMPPGPTQHTAKDKGPLHMAKNADGGPDFLPGLPQVPADSPPEVPVPLNPLPIGVPFE